MLKRPGNLTAPADDNPQLVCPEEALPSPRGISALAEPRGLAPTASARLPHLYEEASGHKPLVLLQLLPAVRVLHSGVEPNLLFFCLFPPLDLILGGVFLS